MAKEFKLNDVKFGLAGGIVTAICVVLSTIAGIYGFLPDYNAIIVSVYGYFGYSLTWLGVLLGAVYGFVDGFILTWVFARIYNSMI